MAAVILVIHLADQGKQVLYGLWLMEAVLEIVYLYAAVQIVNLALSGGAPE